MNIEQKPFEIGCYSVSKIDEEHKVIYQNSSEIHKHEVQKGYQVLSKNDFGKVKKRINVGIFNKKTNFIVGENNSLMFWDNELHEMVTKNISEILENPSRYFMIYDLGFMGDLSNPSLTIKNKESKEEITIKLDKTFGNDIGSFLQMFDPKTVSIPEKFAILKSLIKIESGKLSINKQVLVNSNPDFLLGILEGYLQDSRYFQLKKNINIYNITYILNLLGAQYSIRTLENGEKHIRFKLPIFLKGISSLNEVYFRKYKYFFENKENKELILKKDIISLLPNVENPDFFDMVNNGLIEMIPIKDLVFVELEEPTIMYDLTMPNANATNYSLPGMPLAKNSDGDVLGVIAIHTKDAAEECARKFSTELKENFLNLATGDVNNWGVKLDSQMGLYAATR
jgi:hypothetical protein